MLKVQGISPSSNHEDVFIQRYHWLMALALQLTGNQRASAEDLVQDAFIQFTLRRPDLQQIENIEGYLYRMLRNMHLSQVRRVSYTLNSSLSVVDYDSADIVLYAIDQHSQLQVRDQLSRIAHYARVRSKTSQVGSILILRFFHGYYPGEIALILGRERRTVEDSLRIARCEAKLYLEQPDRLKFKVDSLAPQVSLASGETGDEFLANLRAAILTASRENCLNGSELLRLYQTTREINHDLIAHFVSCRSCLDQINKLLGLSPLSERFAVDSIGRDSSKHDKGGKGGPPTVSGDVAEGFWQRSRRRFKDVLEHQPQELMISVNGFILGSQKVSSGINEQTVNINVPEQIRFVEVFSEQWLRLAFFEIEHPTDGDIEQRDDVEFNDGRSLSLRVRFVNLWPTLNVRYVDNSLVSQVERAAVDEQVESTASDCRVQSSEPLVVSERSRVLVHAISDRFAHALRSISNWRVWVQPAAVTALVAIALAALVIFVNLRNSSTPVSASDMLAKATAAEKLQAARVDQVLHGTINLEERASTGQIISRHRIETWRSAEKGITASRLYDERGELVRGDWRRSDGVETLYHHGAQPRLQNRSLQFASLSFDDAWRLLPSAEDFISLVGTTDNIQFSETATSYVLIYLGPTANSSGLIRGTLVLTRADLHAIEQTLTIKQGDEEREYRFIETSFDRRLPSAVAPTVFEPELELLGESAEKRRTQPAGVSAPSIRAEATAPAVATAGLEVEVLRLLNEVGADLGEQITVTRIPAGQLQIKGLVESDHRKDEILRGLSTLRKNPLVSVEIQTVDEAIKRSSIRTKGMSSSGFEASQTVDRMPVDAELRRYFSIKGVSGEALDHQIASFATRIVNRSQRTQSYAYALRGLATRFSIEDLRDMDKDAHRKWRLMIRQHAAALARETITLHQELGLVFPPNASSADTVSALSSDEELVNAVERLFTLASANNQNVQTAFTISSRSAQAHTPTSPQFWRVLLSVESFASAVAAITQ